MDRLDALVSARDSASGIAVLPRRGSTDVLADDAERYGTHSFLGRRKSSKTRRVIIARL